MEHQGPRGHGRQQLGNVSGMAYTGDTGPADALAELAHDADLLLAEATLADAETSDWGHLCATDAARVAAAAGAGQLVRGSQAQTCRQAAGPAERQATRVLAAASTRDGT
jgi:hypothetical protein